MSQYNTTNASSLQSNSNNIVFLGGKTVRQEIPQASFTRCQNVLKQILAQHPNKEIHLSESTEPINLQIFQSYLSTESLETTSFIHLSDTQILQHLEFCEALHSETYLQQIVNRILFHQLSPSNCMEYLTFTYSKLKHNGQQSSSYEGFYSVFTQCITYIAQSLDQHFSTYSQALKNLPEKIIDEVIDRYLKLKVQPTVTAEQLSNIVNTIVSLKQNKEIIQLIQNRHKVLASKPYNTKTHPNISWKLSHMLSVKEKETAEFQFKQFLLQLCANRVGDELIVSLKLSTSSLAKMENVLDWLGGIVSFYFCVEINGVRETTSFKIDHFVLNAKKSIELKRFSLAEMIKAEQTKVDIVVYLAYDILLSALLNQVAKEEGGDDDNQIRVLNRMYELLCPQDIVAMTTAMTMENGHLGKAQYCLVANWLSSNLSYSDKEISECLQNVQLVIDDWQTLEELLKQDNLNSSLIETSKVIARKYKGNNTAGATTSTSAADSPNLHLVINQNTKASINSNNNNNNSNLIPPSSPTLISGSLLSRPFTSPSSQITNTSYLPSKPNPQIQLPSSIIKCRQVSEDLNTGNTRLTDLDANPAGPSSFGGPQARRSQNNLLPSHAGIKGTNGIPLIADVDTISQYIQLSGDQQNNNNNIHEDKFIPSSNSNMNNYQSAEENNSMRHLNSLKSKPKGQMMMPSQASNSIQDTPFQPQQEQSSYSHSLKAAFKKIDLYDRSNSQEQTQQQQQLYSSSGFATATTDTLQWNSKAQLLQSSQEHSRQPILQTPTISAGLTVSLHSGFVGGSRRFEGQQILDSWTSRADSQGACSRNETPKSINSISKASQQSNLIGVSTASTAQTASTAGSVAANRLQENTAASKPPLVNAGGIGGGQQLGYNNINRESRNNNNITNTNNNNNNTYGYDLKRLLSPPVERTTPIAYTQPYRLLSPQYSSQDRNSDNISTTTTTTKQQQQLLIPEYYSNNTNNPKKPLQHQQLRTVNSFKEQRIQQADLATRLFSNTLETQGVANRHTDSNSNSKTIDILKNNSLMNFNTSSIQAQSSRNNNNNNNTNENTNTNNNNNSSNSQIPVHSIRLKSPQPTTETTRRDSGLNNSSSSNLARVDTSFGNKADLPQAHQYSSKLRSGGALLYDNNKRTQQQQQQQQQYSTSSAMTSPAFKQQQLGSYSEAKDQPQYSSSRFQVKDFSHEEIPKNKESSSQVNSELQLTSLGSLKSIKILANNSSLQQQQQHSITNTNVFSNSAFNFHSAENLDQLEALSPQGERNKGMMNTEDINLYNSSNYGGQRINSPNARYTTTTEPTQYSLLISNSSEHDSVRMNAINDKIVLPLRLMQEKMARKKEILEDISLGSFAITEHFKCVLA